MAIVTAIAALAGLIFGYRFAGGLTRQLKRKTFGGGKPFGARGIFSVHVGRFAQDRLGQVPTIEQMADTLQKFVGKLRKVNNAGRTETICGFAHWWPAAHKYYRWSAA